MKNLDSYGLRIVRNLRDAREDTVRTALHLAEEDLAVAMALETAKPGWLWGGRSIREIVVARLRRVQELRQDLSAWGDIDG